MPQLRFLLYPVLKLPLITKLLRLDRSHEAARLITRGGSYRPGPLRAHSQTVRILHPREKISSCCSRSRCRFPDIFFFQNLALLDGHLKSGQSCPCQKHPCTRMTARYFGKTRSGLPGSFLSWSRYRYPLANSARLITSSGLVSFPLMPAIMRLRVRLSTMSTITRPWAAA